MLTASPYWVQRGARRLWPNLHVLAAVSVPLGAATWVALNVAGHWLSAGLVLLVLLPFPLALALVCTGAVLTDGGMSRTHWRSRGRAAILRLAALGAFVLTMGMLTLVARAAHQAESSVWTGASLLATSAGLIALGALTVVGAPLLAHYPRTRWRSLFVLVVTGLRRAPVPALATLATIVLGVRLALWLPILWAVLPGALLLLVHVAAWTTAAALHITPEEGTTR